MPKSMTGFSRAEVKEDWGTITCELKSVNHRFLDVYFRLPDTLRELEIEFRSQIKGALSRGKIDCSIQLQVISGQDAGINLDLEKASQVISACQRLGREISDAAPLNPMEVLQFPGVLTTSDLDSKKLKVAALSVLKQALGSLNDIRLREGNEMATVVNRRVEAMLEQVAELKQFFPDIKEALENRLKGRFEELKIDADPERLEQELVILAQKMDIDEEIDRLQTHLEEIGRVLKAEEPIGRRLDFLMQELNREANTVSSKSQSLQSTGASVEMKVLIEQMREQIQNIE